MLGPFLRPKYPRSYCLDAPISYRVAEALRWVGWDFVHVSEVEALRVPDTMTGQCKSPDELIAPWCVDNRKVLVTVDADFKGRSARSRLLAQQGLEVIVFDKEIKGALEQHARVTYHLPFWEQALGSQPYGQRIWTQSFHRKGLKQEGQRRR